MRRWLAPVVAAVLAALTVTVVARAQSDGEPCEASRSGDLVVVDLSTCQEVTSSTSAPPTTATATTAAPATTTSSPTAPTTTAAGTTTTATPSTSTTAAPTTSTTPSTTSTPSSTSSTTTTVPAPGGGGFSADFATAADLDRFAWQQSHGGVDPFPRDDQPRQWQGDHDMACGAPDTKRDVHLHGSAGPGSLSLLGDGVWWCAPGGDPAKGHVMTSTVLTAYGHIDFAPARSFRDVRRVCWDMNRSDLGGRKWWQVTIVPEAAYQANGGALDYVKPDLETDVAAAGPHLPVGAFQLVTFRTQVEFSVGDGRRTAADPGGYGQDTFGTPASDRANRYRHCLVDGPGGVTLTVTDHVRGGTTSANYGPQFRFPAGESRVIFQDATYDSIKGDWERGGTPGDTNTWHIDNVIVEVA